jgi:hypothetical protein
MLEIVLCVHIVAGRDGVTRKLQVLVGNRLGVATDLHIRPIALVDAIERIGLTATAASTAATATPVAAAAAPGPVLVMLSLSHPEKSPVRSS